MSVIKSIVNSVSEFCKAPEDSKPLKINVKQLGVGNRTYHIIVRRGQPNEA